MSEHVCMCMYRCMQGTHIHTHTQVHSLHMFTAKLPVVLHCATPVKALDSLL